MGVDSGTDDLAVKPYVHPTQKLTSMNLLQMPCMITWALGIIFDL